MQNQQPPHFPIPPVDDRLIYDLRFQYRSVPMIALAQELGLFEALAERPLGFDELAKASGTDGRVAETMLAVATSFGLLEREVEGQWRLSTVARTYLLGSSPYFCGPLLKADDPGLAELRRACLDVRGPTQAFAVAMKELTDDEIRGFIERMHRLTLPAAGALGRNERFQSVNMLLDLAGGSGSLSIGISAQNTSLRVTLFDLPAVCAIARQNIRDFGLEDRVTTHDGDMFNDPWPQGHDGILFGNIFHDWNEEECKILAQRAYDALEPGGRIFLHEVPLQPEKDGPLTAAAFSVAMILHEHGRQYTVEELHAFLERAGFVDREASHSFGYYWLISARKPPE
jgi:acetylserotonin N-methyltransferase